MDSGRINAMAFSLGVKRSKILLPWEQPPLSHIFGKSKPLIPPAEWVPEPGGKPESSEPDKTVSAGHLLGKKSWTTSKTLIPWPVFEEAKLTKVLELWRIVILDSYKHLSLGLKIHDLMVQDEPDEDALKSVIRDALCGKSISTLRSRVASITSFGRWKKSMFLPEEVSIFPVTEEMAYKYVCELRKEGAPKSRATRFLESLGFCKGMLGADVEDAITSARVRGACVNKLATLEPRKKDPFTVEQVKYLEFLAYSCSDHVGIFAGYLCFLIFGRLRWSDGQFCQEEPWLDEGEEFSYLEARLYHTKTSGRMKLSKRLLPVACAVPGVSRYPWASAWLQHRIQHRLSAGVGKPTMPAPTSDGEWSSLPLGPSEAAVWLREVLSGQGLVGESQALGTHSAKATVLSWMCKAHAPGDLQRLAGYHVDPGTKSSLEYSRDSQAPVLHFIEGLLLVIYSMLFQPDCTRAGRWHGCRSMEQALDIIAKRGNEPMFTAEQPEDLEWERLGDDCLEEPCFSDPYEQGLFIGGVSLKPMETEEQSDESEADPDGFEMPSSSSEGESCEDLEEDEDHLDRAGAAVADIVSRGAVGGPRVFKHRLSGIFHLMAGDSEFPDEEGEMSSTKCGKLISHNFFEVDSTIAFLPAKCKRCFTQ
eukprot:s444_g40.t1